MFKIIWVVAVIVVATAGAARAGDAVAIGYNEKGIWTAVTYYCSSAPPGGGDYKEATAARDAALRDLSKRAGEDLAKWSILSSSDRTGYFVYARGKRSGGKDAHAVGFGNTAERAEKDAINRLGQEGAATNAKVIYRYFSYGKDGVAGKAPR